MQHKIVVRRKQIYCVDCERNLKALEITSIIWSLLYRISGLKGLEKAGLHNSTRKHFEQELKLYQSIRDRKMKLEEFGKRITK